MGSWQPRRDADRQFNIADTGGSYLGDGSVIATSKNFTISKFCRQQVF
jgi:hypothetical protein